MATVSPYAQFSAYAPTRTKPAATTPTSGVNTMTTPTRTPGSNLPDGVSPYGSVLPLLFSNPRTSQWATDKGIRPPAGATPGTPSGGNTNTTPPVFTLPGVNYTPNQNTIDQLGAFGSGRTIPQWMMQDYANKIGQMGGNANGPMPFGVNQSGFPGSTPQIQPQMPPQATPMAPAPSGKTAPYLGIAQGIQSGVQGATGRGMF